MKLAIETIAKAYVFIIFLIRSFSYTSQFMAKLLTLDIFLDILENIEPFCFLLVTQINILLTE